MSKFPITILKARRHKIGSRNKTRVRTAAPADSREVLGLLRYAEPVTVLFLTFVAFSPVLDAGFVNWDDDANFLENPNYRGLGWSQLRWMFTTFYGGHYQPLAWMTFGLDYLLWGMNPFGYHLTNLILHAANALLFYFLVRWLLRSAFSLSTTNQDRLLNGSAALAALLFALHPLRVESVAWATERRDVLSGLFIFSSVLCYLRAVRSSASGRVRWMVGAVMLFALSLLSKAIGITLPAVLLVLDLYPLKRLHDPAKNGLGAIRRQVLLEKVPFISLALIAVLVAAAAQGGVMRTISDHGPGARLSQALFGLVFYAWKTLLPFGLSPLYEMPENFNPLDWRFLISGFMVVAVTLFLFVVRRRWPAGLACWVCYVIILSPVLGIAQSGPQMVADRYSYLSCLSWAALAGGAAYRFYRSSAPAIAKFRPLATGGVITILTLLGIMTWQQSQIWQHSESLWRHVLAVTDHSYFKPSAAHNNLGVVLMNQGQYDEAIRHYREALTINPRFADAYNNLGHSFFRMGWWSESTKYYRQAIDINPSDAQAYYNLGNALTRNNEVDQAIRAYRETLRLNPLDARPHYNIGTIFAQRSELEEAIQSFREAIRLDPNYALAHANLGTALAIRGQFNEAIKHFRQTLRIDPGNSVAHEALARIMALRSNQEERARP